MSGYRVQNWSRTWYYANISLLLTCRASQSSGKTPPARNGTAATLTTPPHAVEDASVAPPARDAVKWRASCHGPSCDVDEMLIHWRNSPRSSPNSTFDKSIRRNPDFSSFESAVNMACVHRDAGRMATVMLMHFPAMRSSVRKEIFPRCEGCAQEIVQRGHLFRGDPERCRVGVAQYS